MFPFFWCQAISYSDAWAKTVGADTAWIPTLIVVFKTWSACLIYSIIIADLTVDLCATAGVKSLIFGGSEFLLSRSNIILATHIFGLLPLCLLR
jgi:amino acid permease